MPYPIYGRGCFTLSFTVIPCFCCLSNLGRVFGFRSAYGAYQRQLDIEGMVYLMTFWKLIERWKATFMVTVPTAASQLLQRPVNADISSLNAAFCGSAPMPVELFKRFQAK